MKYYFLLSVIFLLMVVAEELYGQEKEYIRFQHLTQEHGLSQGTVTTMLQDKYGYLWIGTQNGLNKFNGYEMTIFQHNPLDTTTVASSQISVLMEDQNGTLWVGTTGSGLSKFNRDTYDFTHFKTDYVDHHLSISDNSIQALMEDSGGRFWIGTGAGLNWFDRENNNWIHFFNVPDDPESLSASSITSLYEDSNETIWIGTTQGLNYWDHERGIFHHYKHEADNPQSISHNAIHDIYEDSRGNLWVGTEGGGLNRLDREKGTFQRFQHHPESESSISGNNILSIYEDSRGSLWVGTENQGLNVYDFETGDFYHYEYSLINPHSLNNNSVYSIYETSDNMLWIGTFAGGLNYFDRNEPTFLHFFHDPFNPHSLGFNNVSSFVEVENGKILIGTDGGGLNVFDPETERFTRHLHDPEDPNSVTNNVVISLLKDSRGRIWKGYYGGGISMHDPATGEVRRYRYDPEDPHSLSNDHVFVMDEDSDGVMWFGTNGGGLNRYNEDSGTFTHTKSAGIDHDTDSGIAVLRALFEDTRGNYWLGVYGGGLKRFDREKMQVTQNFFKGENGLTSNVVMIIHEDMNGNLWVGTNEGGLHLFDYKTETFTNYSVAEGMNNPVVDGLLEDDEGRLWMSTNNGIDVFDPRDESFTHYNVEHGLQSRDFNPLSYYRDSNGYMYFGGTNGFNRFHPDSIRIDENVAPVVFTDFLLFNQAPKIAEENSPLQKHISQTEKITLPYDTSVLTFEYAALNFNYRNGYQYAYKMEGFDQDWIEVGNRRSVTYTNLNPGEYLLRVRTANIYGVWSKQEAKLAVVITPPYWMTIWFYLIVIALISGLVYVGHRYRVQRISDRNVKLEEEVARRTKDANEALVRLKKTQNELIENAHKAGMADLAVNVLHNVGNILNSVNVSSAMIDTVVNESSIHKLQKANELLKQHENNLKEFISENPKGVELLRYYLKLKQPIDEDIVVLKAHNKRLAEKVQLIIDVVSTQQRYSTGSRLIEEHSLEQLVDDTLTFQESDLSIHDILIIKDFEEIDPVPVEKSKLMHVLINLLKNAKESVLEQMPNEKVIQIRTFQDDHFAFVSIQDNGIGIEQERESKIFMHGFTTKQDGHGYGLHSCANYMKEMGGSISIQSDGVGKGATFTLKIPKTFSSGSVS